MCTLCGVCRTGGTLSGKSLASLTSVKPNPCFSASHDILRIYDLQAAQAESKARHSAVPFTIIPGHRGGVISAIYVDPACRFMLSAAGNRGWESGAGTEVLLGYEIGIQDPNGVWHK
jgi:transcriptional activator SPT8